jgi:hypothetical protein
MAPPKGGAIRWFCAPGVIFDLPHACPGSDRRETGLLRSRGFRCRVFSTRNLRYRRGEKTRRGGVRAKAVVDGLEVDQASALHAVSFSWSAVAFGGDGRDDGPAISEEGRRK